MQNIFLDQTLVNQKRNSSYNFKWPKFEKRIDDDIPKGAIHRVENKSHNSLVIYEAQISEVLKEADIIRFKDDYGRAKK